MYIYNKLRTAPLDNHSVFIHSGFTWMAPQGGLRGLSFSQDIFTADHEVD